MSNEQIAASRSINHYLAKSTSSRGIYIQKSCAPTEQLGGDNALMADVMVAPIRMADHVAVGLTEP